MASALRSKSATTLRAGAKKRNSPTAGHDDEEPAFRSGIQTDLRSLKMNELDAILRDEGISDENIGAMKRWPKVHLLRDIIATRARGFAGEVRIAGGKMVQQDDDRYYLAKLISPPKRPTVDAIKENNGDDQEEMHHLSDGDVVLRMLKLPHVEKTLYEKFQLGSSGTSCELLGSIVASGDFEFVNLFFNNEVVRAGTLKFIGSVEQWDLTCAFLVACTMPVDDDVKKIICLLIDLLFNSPHKYAERVPRRIVSHLFQLGYAKHQYPICDGRKLQLEAYRILQAQAGKFDFSLAFATNVFNFNPSNPKSPSPSDTEVEILNHLLVTGECIPTARDIIHLTAVLKDANDNDAQYRLFKLAMEKMGYDTFTHHDELLEKPSYEHPSRADLVHSILGNGQTKMLTLVMLHGFVIPDYSHIGSDFCKQPHHPVYEVLRRGRTDRIAALQSAGMAIDPRYWSGWWNEGEYDKDPTTRMYLAKKRREAKQIGSI